MPVPYIVTFTTTGAKTPCIVDYSQSPFNLSVAAAITTGTCTYGIEYTLDDVNNSTAIAPVYFQDANLPATTATSGVTNYMFPVQAIRINISAISGSVRFIVLQGTPQL